MTDTISALSCIIVTGLIGTWWVEESRIVTWTGGASMVLNGLGKLGNT